MDLTDLLFPQETLESKWTPFDGPSVSPTLQDEFLWTEGIGDSCETRGSSRDRQVKSVSLASETTEQSESLYWMKLAKQDDKVILVETESTITQLNNRGFKSQVRFWDWCGAQADHGTHRRRKGRHGRRGPTSDHVGFKEGGRLVDRAQVLGALAANHCLSHGRA